MKGSRLDDASTLGVLIDRPALDESKLLLIEPAEEAWRDESLDPSGNAIEITSLYPKQPPGT